MKYKYSLIIISMTMMLSILIPGGIFLEQYTKDKILILVHDELENVAEATVFSLPKVAVDATVDELIALLDPSIQSLATALETRITLIDLSGTVLADSLVDSSKVTFMENHALRPEVVQAHSDGHGKSLRHSETAGVDVMYVAVKISPTTNYSSSHSNLEKPLIVRASRPLSTIDSTIADFHYELIKAGVVITLLAIVLSVAGVVFLGRRMKDDSDSLEARVELRTEEIVMLQMLSSLLNTCASLEEAAKVLTELAPKLLPNTSGGISIYKASRNRLDLLCQWGSKFDSQLSLNPHDCWALRKGHQHHASNRGVYLPCEHWQGEASDTLCVPLLAQGETVGALHLDYHEVGVQTHSAHICEAVAEQTGLTLANIQLRQQLREQARRDPMTGLYNRMYLAEVMEDYLHNCLSNERPCAVLMLDADHFKRFNDNFGHDAGDLVLKSISKEISRAAEDIGTACRYGGEEFCIFLTDADQNAALNCAERIRSAVSVLSLTQNNLALGSVSISIGVSVGPAHAKESKTLISLADEALYKAKDAGRDQVVLYEEASPLPIAPQLKEAC